jgi:hypothetical protein
MTLSTDFESRYAAHMRSVQDRKDQAINNLITVFRYLKQQCPDLGRIEITYSGSGDSGQTENVYYFNAAGQLFDPPESLDSTSLPPDISPCGANATPAEVIDAAAWDVAYGQHPGFEINEGGYGTVRVGLLDLSSDAVSVRLEHHDIIETTEDYEYNFAPSEASA